MPSPLDRLEPGMRIVWGGSNIALVSRELADAFAEGDALIVRQDDGELIHVPSDALEVADHAVGRAVKAFAAMGTVPDDRVTDFYLRFADALEDDERFGTIAAANAADVASARARGRSVTRLILDDAMRRGMIEGLRGWAKAPSGRGRIIATTAHDGWRVDEVVDGLGVIGFVFEGRPNVFADATGVLRSGNTVVFRIGSDALGTARAITDVALGPALAAAGLPDGAVSLVDSPLREAGIAMVADARLSLAVARGSGAATQRLGAVARQAGNAVSLHGTGGAWIVAGASAEASDVAAAVYHSLDRKVCNTLNTLCIPRARSAELIPAFLHALTEAGRRRGTNPKLHVVERDRDVVPSSWFENVVAIARARGDVDEPMAEVMPLEGLAIEWEWEDSPEVTLVLVEDVDDAVDLFNSFSPHFVASLISDDVDEQERFFAAVDAPFVGNGFTRWVDGQYALGKPELGLSNWQNGRLFGRGGILSGDGVYTVRMRVTQDDPDIGR